LSKIVGAAPQRPESGGGAPTSADTLASGFRAWAFARADRLAHGAPAVFHAGLALPWILKSVRSGKITTQLSAVRRAPVNGMTGAKGE